MCGKSFFSVFVSVATSLLLLTGCNGAEVKETEEAEDVASEEMAAQMAGRNAARPFVSKEWTDSVALFSGIRKAREKGLKYDAAGKRNCAVAYDSAFLRTIRSVRPELASKIKDL